MTDTALATETAPSPTGIEPGREYTYEERIQSIRATKMAQTKEKQEVIGAMDYDDWALVLPPEDKREIVEAVSGSGLTIRDCIIPGVEIDTNHECGGFFGPEICGRNFRRLLEAHPAYIDPMSSLAGAYMANFSSYRKVGWNPDVSAPEDLQMRRELYKLAGGIGGAQHFCQDMVIGFELGWQGLADKVARYRSQNPDRAEFYDGLDHVIAGMQAWIRTNAAEARRLAGTEENPQLRQSLEEQAEMNERLATEPPRTLRDVCQWILWYDCAARMYNGSGSLGRLDEMLRPYYEREKAAGTLTDEEAIFHIACLLVRDTAYIQLGGPGQDGADLTTPVSFLVLEATHRLKVPANTGVCVGDDTDPELLKRSVEILLEDRLGIPKFLGIDRTTEGFMRNDIPVEVARTRAYSGCHWSALPGREYTLNDCVKISFGNIFDVALREMMADDSVEPSIDELWRRFDHHTYVAVDAMAESFDIHLEHMGDVFPELMLDLLCHGPVEKGYDAADGYNKGVEYYNMCVDGCALATIADSFAALELHVQEKAQLTWQELLGHLDANWEGTEGERARLLMKRTPRYGYGGTRADEYARRIAELFTKAVKRQPTPAGFNMIPGIFSWANTIGLGRILEATPNGRHKGAPISHGSNPDPGFRKDGAPTALATAIAEVQPGYGNAAPMQIELDPTTSAQDGEAVNRVADLIRTHFDMGGTQINFNILDREKVLEAHEDPTKYPDLVVRVTGFSAYFASLSKEFRQLVVDRIISEN